MLFREWLTSLTHVTFFLISFQCHSWHASKELIIKAVSTLRWHMTDSLGAASFLLSLLSAMNDISYFVGRNNVVYGSLLAHVCVCVNHSFLKDHERQQINKNSILHVQNVKISCFFRNFEIDCGLPKASVLKIMVKHFFWMWTYMVHVIIPCYSATLNCFALTSLRYYFSIHAYLINFGTEQGRRNYMSLWIYIMTSVDTH